MSSGIPAVIAVPSHRFADWVKYSEGMSVKLSCSEASLHRWWLTISARQQRSIVSSRETAADLPQ